MDNSCIITESFQTGLNRGPSHLSTPFPTHHTHTDMHKVGSKIQRPQVQVAS